MVIIFRVSKSWSALQTTNSGDLEMDKRQCVSYRPRSIIVSEHAPSDPI
jgi:hypothetical protein